MYLEYFETTAEDSVDHWHWDAALKEKMLEPVAPNGKCHFDSRRTLTVINLAWFENPDRPVQIPMWDEATKRKMRQPVLANGCHHLNDEAFRKLIELI
jgi:hypothetical protein